MEFGNSFHKWMAVYLNPPEPFKWQNIYLQHIKAFFNATYIERSYSANEDMITLQWSLTSTALFIGCFLGAIGTGFIAKKLGRYVKLFFFKDDLST